MNKLNEFSTYKAALERHRKLDKLGWRVFSIFQTNRGTWAFWSH